VAKHRVGIAHRPGQRRQQHAVVDSGVQMRLYSALEESDSGCEVDEIMRLDRVVIVSVQR
jgi:hypothetical protein